MKRVLILCTGNSCRSQMAAAFLQAAAPDAIIRSAGTEPAPQVNAGAVKYMKEIGIDLSRETPKSVTQYLDEPWDFVITVCGGANESCPAFLGVVGERVHIGFEDPSHMTGSPEFIEASFRRIRDDIKQRFTQFAIDHQL